MHDILHAALFPESLSDAERAEARRVLAGDAAARRTFERVQALQAHVADATAETVGDRETLVLGALVEAGYGDVLSAADRARLQQRPNGAPTPTLATIRTALTRDIEAFERAWEEEAHSTPPPPSPARVDRAPRARARPVRWAWRVGVGMAVVAFAAVAILLVQRDASYVTIELAQGETRALTLADGSTVRLFSGARLTYSDPDADAVFNRQVTLAGDAFFAVQPGTQSFVVRTGEAEVRVLGTAFGVRAGDEGTEVTLVEGRVLFAPSGAPTRGVTLAPGQQSVLAAGAQVPSPPTEVDARDALGWTGLFFFDETPMRDVAVTLSEGLEMSIEIAPALAGEPVTGTFDKAQGAEQIVKTLATTLGVDARRTRTGWKLGE